MVTVSPICLAVESAGIFAWPKEVMALTRKIAIEIILYMPVNYTGKVQVSAAIFSLWVY